MCEAVGRKDWKNEIVRSLIKCEWIDAFSRACSPIETTRSSKWWTEPKEEFKVTFVARRRRSRLNLFFRVSIICLENWQPVYEPNRLVFIYYNISLLYPCSIRALYFYVVTAQNSRPHCVTHRYRGVPDTYLPPNCTLLRRLGIWWSRRVVTDVKTLCRKCSNCAVNVIVLYIYVIFFLHNADKKSPRGPVFFFYCYYIMTSFLVDAVANKTMMVWVHSVLPMAGTRREANIQQHPENTPSSPVDNGIRPPPVILLLYILCFPLKQWFSVFFIRRHPNLDP